MSRSTATDHDLTSYLDHIRALRFVRELTMVREPMTGARRFDALVTIRTVRGVFKLGLEVRRSFLEDTVTNALVAEHLRLEKEHGVPLLLVARYVPRPTGERLAASGVNFVDRAGNINLQLGDEYHVHVLGRREASRDPIARQPGQALIQLIFLLLAEPEAVAWPIRAMAAGAGIGKTAAALGRQRLVADRLVTRRGATFQVRDRKALGDEFVESYARILRTHLLLGRFRAAESDPERLLASVAAAATRANVGWAATGAPAAYVLQHFYRDERVPLLLTELRPEFQRELRLSPDRHGPITLLRAFGDHWLWQTVGNVPVAQPWLIYAELVHRAESRALEAAEMFRDEFLKS